MGISFPERISHFKKKRLEHQKKASLIAASRYGSSLAGAIGVSLLITDLANIPNQSDLTHTDKMIRGGTDAVAIIITVASMYFIDMSLDQAYHKEINQFNVSNGLVNFYTREEKRS